MRSLVPTLVVLILSALASPAFWHDANFSAGAQSAPSRTQQPEIPFLGFDPVLLIQGREIQGNLNISTIRGRYKYLFATAENKARFEQSPERYEIQLGGVCAREGAGGQIRDAEIYFVYKDHLYVFHSFECQQAFAAAPESFFENPASGPKINLSPEALKKGALLIEKAVAAMGGALLIDGLSSYQESATTSEMTSGPDGRKASEVKNSTTIVFPNQIRRDQISSGGNVTLVIVPNEAFGLFQNRVFPLPSFERESRERQIKLKPLSILRERNNASFKASATDPRKVGDLILDQVIVEFDGLTMALGIDPDSGRVQSLSYRGRGPNYNFGAIEQLFSDFQTVEGVTLPFKIRGTFNDQPEPTQSSIIQSIKINEKIDPVLFERPKRQ